MDLQKQTPVFKTLEQPIIPYEKSGPRRFSTILISFLLSMILCIVLVIMLNNKQIIIIKYI
jgi:uncharacterized protein involved in exopolysaccharide biosynthesis